MYIPRVSRKFDEIKNFLASYLRMAPEDPDEVKSQMPSLGICFRPSHHAPLSVASLRAHERLGGKRKAGRAREADELVVNWLLGAAPEVIAHTPRGMYSSS